MSVLRAVVVAFAVCAAVLSKGAIAAEPARIEAVVVETGQGRFTFQTEIADTPELRERGLMFRHRMPQDRAMLFNWGSVGDVSMWMKNTYIALDMVFIAKSGQVMKVAENTVPFSETVIPSEAPVAAVLEVVAGTAKRIGLKAGDRVSHAMFDSAGD